MNPAEVELTCAEVRAWKALRARSPYVLDGRGAREILLTALHSDGTREGYAL